MELTYQDVLEILRIVDASDSQELILELGNTKLIVRKGTPGAPGASASLAAVHAGTPAPAPVAEAAPTPVVVAAPAAAHANGAVRRSVAAAHPGAVAIKAPMVGRFYRSPSPEAPPFVEVGSLVSPDDVVCIAEVMKLFNQIKAGVKGRVVAIAVENGDMVEFGQEMIFIEPVD